MPKPMPIVEIHTARRGGYYVSESPSPFDGGSQACKKILATYANGVRIFIAYLHEGGYCEVMDVVEVRHEPEAQK